MTAKKKGPKRTRARRVCQPFTRQVKSSDSHTIQTDIRVVMEAAHNLHDNLLAGINIWFQQRLKGDGLAEVITLQLAARLALEAVAIDGENSLALNLPDVEQRTKLLDWASKKSGVNIRASASALNSIGLMTNQALGLLKGDK